MKRTYLYSLIMIGFTILLVACGGDNPSKGKKSVTKPEKKEMKAKAPKKEAKKAAKKKEVKEDPNAIPTPPEHLAKADEIIAAISDSDIEAVDAKKKFKNLCAICHGTKGNMKINGAKDLTKSNISLTESVAQVYHGKGLMTPYKGILTDAEIVAVAKYTESLRK